MFPFCGVGFQLMVPYYLVVMGYIFIDDMGAFKGSWFHGVVSDSDSDSDSDTDSRSDSS